MVGKKEYVWRAQNNAHHWYLVTSGGHLLQPATVIFEQICRETKNDSGRYVLLLATGTQVQVAGVSLYPPLITIVARKIWTSFTKGRRKLEPATS